MSDWIAVGHYNNVPEAHLGLSLLKEADIPAVVEDPHMGTLYGQGIGGVRLLVNPEQADRAVQILTQESDPLDN